MNNFYDMLAVPFGHILHLFYNWFGSYWLALILLVLIVRLILLPSAVKQQKGTAKQLRLQPKVNKIKAKYSTGGTTSREAQMQIQQETQELYRSEGYSAMNAGCLPLLIQFPVMIGLYGVIYTPLSKVLQISSDAITAAVSALGLETTSQTSRQVEIALLNTLTKDNMPASLAEHAASILRLKSQFQIGSISLTETPSVKDPSLLWLIPILAFVSGMLTSVVMYVRQRKTNPEMASNPSMGCMTFTSPLMSLVFTFMFPAGVGVYWILSAVVTFIQTIVLNYALSPEKVIADNMIDETVQRRSREAHIKKLKTFSEQTDK